MVRPLSSSPGMAIAASWVLFGVEINVEKLLRPAFWAGRLKQRVSGPLVGVPM
jgi:hypothetical protein